MGIGRNGVLSYLPPRDDNAYAGSEWGGNKVLWAVAPSVNTVVLVRGRQLDGTDRVRFGQDINPDKELLLGSPTRGELRLGGGWRGFPSATRLKHAGCYGYQVDTPSTSSVIVFEAR